MENDMRKIVYAASALLMISLLFTSCENFLKGSELQQNLNDAIEYAQAEEFSIFVTDPNGYGNVSRNTDAKIKKGDYLSISFTLNSVIAASYKFDKWVAVDRNDITKSMASYVYFEDEKSQQTKIRLLGESNDVLIYPFCIAVPKVVSIDPQNIDTGVSYNKTVTVEFNNNINPDSFRFSQNEVRLLNIDDKDLLKVTEKTGEQTIYGYSQLGNVYFKNISISSTNGERLEQYFLAPAVIGGKTLELKVDNSKTFPIKADETKGIKVVIAPGVMDERLNTMTGDYNFVYTINSEAEKETPFSNVKITSDSLGNVNLEENSLKCFINKEFSLEFEPHSYVTFEEWQAVFETTGLDASEYVIFTNKTALKTKFKVIKEDIFDICIKPKGEVRPYILETTPYNGAIGVPINSSIKIRFSTPVNIENFRFTTEEVTAAGGTDKQIDSFGYCYSYAKGGSTYFKNIEIKTKGGVSLCDKFEAPYFDDNNTLVINLKKEKELPKNTNIFVNVSNKVKAGDLYIDGNNLSGFASNAFATSYISENQVPYFTEVGLYGNSAYRGITSLNKQFKIKVENETANTDYSNNRFNEKIYFLVRAYDDKKIEKLIVKETYVYDYANDTEVASPVTNTTEYAWNPNSDDDFIFEHSVKNNKAGVYKIIVSLKDDESAVSEDNYEFVCLNMNTIDPELSYFTNIPAMEKDEEFFLENILNNVKKVRFAFEGGVKFNPFKNKSLIEKYPGFKIKTADVTAVLSYQDAGASAKTITCNNLTSGYDVTLPIDGNPAKDYTLKLKITDAVTGISVDLPQIYTIKNTTVCTAEESIYSRKDTYTLYYLNPNSADLKDPDFVVYAKKIDAEKYSYKDGEYFNSMDYRVSWFRINENIEYKICYQEKAGDIAGWPKFIDSVKYSK